jgi:hypothetical protein
MDASCRAEMRAVLGVPVPNQSSVDTRPNAFDLVPPHDAPPHPVSTSNVSYLATERSGVFGNAIVSDVVWNIA